MMGSAVDELDDFLKRRDWAAIQADAAKIRLRRPVSAGSRGHSAGRTDIQE